MPPEPRPVYVPSGRFVPSNVLVGGLALAGIGLLIASFLAWEVRQGCYGVVSDVAIPALGLCLLIRLIVARSKTRNRFVGLNLGLLTGTISVGGMYHIDQCTRWGIGWEQIDRLPGYITFRMATDQWWKRGPRRQIVTPMPAQARVDPWLPPQVECNWQWAGFFAEVGALVVIPTTLGLQRARRPFSERSNDWFTHELLRLTPQSASRLGDAMAEGTVPGWIATGVEKTVHSEPHTRLAVWYCRRPKPTGPGEPAVYVALADGPLYLLSLAEAAALAAIVPALAEQTSPDPVRFASTPTEAPDRSVATLVTLPTSPYLESRQYTILRWLYRLSMTVTLLIPFPIVVVLMSVIGGQALAAGQGVWAAAVGGCVCGGGSLWVLYWWFSRQSSPVYILVRLYNYIHLIGQLAYRTDALIDHTHPDAVHLQMIPRGEWFAGPGHRRLSDSGLLLLDPIDQRIVYEGERYRYVIPASAIVHCGIEHLTSPEAKAAPSAVVLVVRAQDEDYEIPLFPLSGIGVIGQAQKALILQNRILAEFAIPTRPLTDSSVET